MRSSSTDHILTDALSPHIVPWVVNEFHSDHLPVRFDITTKINTKPPKNILNYQLANWQLFRQRIDRLLDDYEQSNNIIAIDKVITHFTRCTQEAKSYAIPIKRPTKDFLDTETLSKLKQLK